MAKNEMLQELLMNDLLLCVERYSETKITFKKLWNIFKSNYHDIECIQKYSNFKKNIIEYAKNNKIVEFQQVIYNTKNGCRKYQKVIYKKNRESSWTYYASRYRRFHRKYKNGIIKRPTKEELKQQNNFLEDFIENHPEMLKEKVVCFLFGMSSRNYFKFISMFKKTNPGLDKVIVEEHQVKNQESYLLDVLNVSRSIYDLPDYFSMYQFLEKSLGSVDMSNPRTRVWMRKSSQIFKNELGLKKIRMKIDGKRRWLFIKRNFERAHRI